MTYEERNQVAIDTMQFFKQKLNNGIYGEFVGNFDTAISALEKQIPKKPTYEEIGNVYGALKRTCAKCGDVCLISEDAKPFEHYCRYCGQKIDWSDSE